MKHITIIFTLLIVNSISAQCFIENANHVSGYNVSYSTNDSNVNKEYESANIGFSRIFRLKVRYGFYDDSQTGANAFAMPHNSSSYDGKLTLAQIC